MEASTNASNAMTLNRRLALAVAAALLMIIGGVTAAILVLCHGHLIYSLDDPYISLALGDSQSRSCCRRGDARGTSGFRGQCGTIGPRTRARFFGGDFGDGKANSFGFRGQ